MLSKKMKVNIFYEAFNCVRKPIVCPSEEGTEVNLIVIFLISYNFR